MASKNASHKNGNGRGKQIATIALAAGAVAAAAGTYFFAGQKNAKRREALRGWAVKARGEIMEKIENLREIDAKTYLGIVDGVMKQYQKIKKISPSEIADLARELKDQWGNLEKESKKKAPAVKAMPTKKAASPRSKKVKSKK